MDNSHLLLPIEVRFNSKGGTCLHVPNVPVGTSGCAERVCLHQDGCARMRSAYPECHNPNLSAHPGQDGGCAVSLTPIPDILATLLVLNT